MKYFKDANNQIFAFESDGSGDRYIKAGMIPITEGELAALRAPTLQDIARLFDEAVEARLHAEAVGRGYTNIERACMYAAYPNPYWEESKSFVEWVGAVWAYCYQELIKVEHGIRPVPDLPSFITELPERGYINV